MTLSISIPLKRIYDLIVSANESGSGYWARVIREKVPAVADVSWMDDPEDLKTWPHHGAALCGGSVTYGVLDDSTGKVGRERYTLNAKTIAKGLQIMSTKYGQHFGNFMSKNDDAETADVFLQCCLLGEVQFG
jgi:hypothetical protein